MRKIEPKTRKDLREGPIDSSKEKVFPTFRIENIYLPESKDWDVGKEYTITLKLKMTGYSNSKFQKDSEYDIIGIDPKSSKHNSDHK